MCARSVEAVVSVSMDGSTSSVRSVGVAVSVSMGCSAVSAKNAEVPAFVSMVGSAVSAKSVYFTGCVNAYLCLVFKAFGILPTGKFPKERAMDLYSCRFCTLCRSFTLGRLPSDSLGLRGVVFMHCACQS